MQTIATLHECKCVTFCRYFADIKAMKQHNGRAFPSELELIAKTDSSVFPHIACNNLLGQAVAPSDVLRGKCSVVTIAMRDSADRDLQQWVTGLGLREQGCPWNWVELSFIDNWLLQTMHAQMTAKLAEKVPPHRHPLYLVCYGDAAIAQAVRAITSSHHAIL